MSRFDSRRDHDNRALLVGVSRYDHIRSKKKPDGVAGNLPGVEHNVNRLKVALSGGGVFDDGEITVSHSPSLDEFSEALRLVAQEAKGLLLLYFAGHGAVPSAGNELFLQMRNARVVAGGRAVFPGAAMFSSVLTELAGSHAKQIVVILDCCYAGNAAGIWRDFGDRDKIRVLMSVQANRLIHGGDGEVPTPFTRELLPVLGQSREVFFQELFAAVSERMRVAGYKTRLGDPQEPQEAREGNTDVLLGARDVAVFQNPRPRKRNWLRFKKRFVALTRLRRDGVRTTARRRLYRGRPVTRAAVSAVLVLAASGLGYALISHGDDVDCVPALELRVLTDPDLKSTVRAAADAYMTSEANTTGDGCRRSGLTVYDAGAADAVGALRKDTDAWQEPVVEDDNPQRDVGPQPDVWIPASAADVTRVVRGREGRSFAELESFGGPFAYSPVVLAVPRDLAGSVEERKGRSLTRLLDDLHRQDANAEVRRPDPEFTTAALLATLGLYGGKGDAAGSAGAGAAERRLAPGAPAPTASDLLCALPEDSRADQRTAVLAPEFLLKSGVACHRATRTPRLAAYPSDVPGLTPTFVPVRWKGADLDAEAREDAVNRFHRWLTDEDGGLAVFRDAGFRSADGDRPLLDPDHAGTGVLRDPGPPVPAAERTAMDTTLTRYRGASGPGRVLYLLDNSGSMSDYWEGPSGGPGILKQSLGGLGDQDQYGMWTVSGTSGARHGLLLGFGKHQRVVAERILDPRRTKVRDAEADPPAALLAAFTDMAGRGNDDDGPRLIVFLTDDEDNTRLTGRNLDQVLEKARETKVPVVMVSLEVGACDRGRPDARIAEASGGRCLDASDDLGAGLHDEVARAGTGED
ncbi:VWA domain-containing protein [Streptomyces griseus]|uniref:VWA domain-containing protein n=1 Tax=Streptomyces griseus TaxID=1911 RepID=UPI000569F72D|nr:VWA domain-containing protein [Streptomyces griseus]